jgi:hypothetical protein
MNLSCCDIRGDHLQDGTSACKISPIAYLIVSLAESFDLFGVKNAAFIYARAIAILLRYWKEALQG